MENACMHDTGEFLMKIIKIVNNNIVTSLDEQNREIIVMGRGLGFGRKPGMTIDDGKVEKVFRLNSAGENQKLVDIIQDIPRNISRRQIRSSSMQKVCWVKN